MKQCLSTIRGSCHCGNIQFEFKTAYTPETLPIRNCQCSFCTMHGAATARDPDGEASIKAREADLITLYRFATHSTDFILCANCGVYVGAAITFGQRKFVTLNMNLTALDTRRASPVNHADEAADTRIASRVESFTPMVSYPFP